MSNTMFLVHFSQYIAYLFPPIPTNDCDISLSIKIKNLTPRIWLHVV